MRPTVSHRVQQAAKATLLVISSVLITLLMVEWTLPLVVNVTDRINYVAVPGVGLGLQPNQEGRFIREGVNARFHINASGFNNPEEYVIAHPAGAVRIAVVGDSFIEAFHVNPGEALYSVLEARLRADGVPAQVYSFGVSGFGTSQVFRMVEDTVLPYSPDMVIYLFIRNDLSDSSPCLDRATWTRQYDLADDGRLVELPVGHYATTWWSDLLRRSRLFQYIFYQRRLLEVIRARGHAPAGASAGGPSPCTDRSWRIVEALLAKMRDRLAERNIPLLVVWQGDSEPDYAAEIRDGLRRVAERQGLSLFDPTPAFQAEAAIIKRPFRIPGDGHWNADGHRVVGTALAPIVERMLPSRK